MGDYGVAGMSEMAPAQSQVAMQPEAPVSQPSAASVSAPAPSGEKKKLWLIILVGVILIAAVGAFMYFFNPFAVKGSVGLNP